MNKSFFQLFFYLGLMINFWQMLHCVDIEQISLLNFMDKYPVTQYVQCTKNCSFNRSPFPLYPEIGLDRFPNQGSFSDIFIICAAQSWAHFDHCGYVFINDCFIKETQIKDLDFFQGYDYLQVQDCQHSMQVSGRVAIVSHLYPYCYGHFILDVIGQLALLELCNIEYDYLCIPYNERFMQEILEIWGIEKSKIIPLSYGLCIHADEIVMSTPVTATQNPNFNSNYSIDILMYYIRNKMLTGAQRLNNNQEYDFSEKIFISRQDAALSKRAVPNEDQIFALFESHGFKKYSLSSLSMVEQILLFNNAKTIVSFVGSGGMNLIYCKPGTQYVEIFQSMVDATFFYLSDMFQLQYYYINQSTYDDVIHGLPWSQATNMPLTIFYDFLKNHPEL